MARRRALLRSGLASLLLAAMAASPGYPPAADPTPADTTPQAPPDVPAAPRGLAITEYTKVFAPRLGGATPTCQVTYRLSGGGQAADTPGTVALQVYKAGVAQPVISRLYTAGEVTSLGRERYRVRWDGRKDGGNWAGGGRYRFQVKHYFADGTWVAADTPEQMPMHLVHVGITELDFVDYDPADPRHRVYPLMFNEKSETDPADVNIDVEWQVPDIFTPEARPSTVYTSQARLRNWPVCLMKGGKLRAMVRTDGQGYGPGTGLRIKLASPGLVGADDIAPGRWYGLPSGAGHALPRVVNKHRAFPVPIQFYAVRNGKEELLGTQRTTHVLYTVNAPPGRLAKAETGRSYVTVADISCRLVAGSQDIFGSIWAGFWNLTMDVPGSSKPLVFTAAGHQGRMELGELLDPDPKLDGQHWGRCSAWARFHAALLAVHGEPVSAMAVVPRGPLGFDLLLFRVDLPAQSNPNPQYRDFLNHGLTQYRGRWYDPSFRMPKGSRGYASLHAWEQAVIEKYHNRFTGWMANDAKKTEVEAGPPWPVEVSEATLAAGEPSLPSGRGGAR